MGYFERILDWTASYPGSGILYMNVADYVRHLVSTDWPSRAKEITSSNTPLASRVAMRSAECLDSCERF